MTEQKSMIRIIKVRPFTVACLIFLLTPLRLSIAMQKYGTGFSIPLLLC